MPNFWQFVMFEGSSGVGTSNFGEMGQRCLMVKRRLYKNKLLVKLSRAPFLYSHLLVNVKRLRPISPKLGVLTPLEHSLNTINCQKWGEIPYQNMSF